MSLAHPAAPSDGAGSRWGIDVELMDRILASRALPSPPSVAARLIELGGDPQVGLADLVEAMRPDPALTARVLRLANSPLYARRRRAENLHQAVVMLGMDAVFTAALSLTLMSDRQALGSTGLSFTSLWSRSVHAAAAAQVVATNAGGLVPGDAFLAGLLQDIGVLVLGRVGDDTYRGLPAGAAHGDLVGREAEKLGVDHSVVGAALLDSWNLPPAIVDAVHRSHVGGSADDADDRLVNAVAVGGLIADWLAGDDDQLLAARGTAAELLGLDDIDFAVALDQIAAALPDLATLLEAKAPPVQQLAELAADAMVDRQLHQHHVIDKMREDLADLTEVARQLEIASRTDGLTGLLNRQYLDGALDEEFHRSRRDGYGMAVLFIDLDDFKGVNDRHGHHVGDDLLRSCADRIADTLRDEDLVGRYGGDEFVVVLPATRAAQAAVVAERVVSAFEAAPFELEGGLVHHQLVSVGIAGCDGNGFDSVDDLVRSADAALLDAKRAGKSAWRARPRSVEEADDRADLALEKVSER